MAERSKRQTVNLLYSYYVGSNPTLLIHFKFICTYIYMFFLYTLTIPMYLIFIFIIKYDTYEVFLNTNSNLITNFVYKISNYWSLIENNFFFF